MAPRVADEVRWKKTFSNKAESRAAEGRGKEATALATFHRGRGGPSTLLKTHLIQSGRRRWADCTGPCLLLTFLVITVIVIIVVIIIFFYQL